MPASTQGEESSEPTSQAPGFGERGRMRRRARFLRKARELAYRDLGGLVFDLHRFGQRNDQVVLAKLATLGHMDAELRALEEALRELRPVTVLREAGIAACPRCAAIHGSDDRFCPGCGLAFDMSADRPLSTAPVTGPAPGASLASAPATASAPAAGTLGAATPADHAGGLSIGRPTTSANPIEHHTTSAEPAPPVKPTATPVAARPAFSTLSRPVQSQTPEPATSGEGARRDEPTSPDPPATSTPHASPPPSSPPPSSSPPSSTPPSSSPPSSTPSQTTSADNGEQSREPEDEPTQVLRPPARGA